MPPCSSILHAPLFSHALAKTRCRWLWRRASTLPARSCCMHQPFLRIVVASAPHSEPSSLPQLRLVSRLHGRPFSPSGWLLPYIALRIHLQAFPLAPLPPQACLVCAFPKIQQRTPCLLLFRKKVPLYNAPGSHSMCHISSAISQSAIPRLISAVVLLYTLPIPVLIPALSLACPSFSRLCRTAVQHLGVAAQLGGLVS